jgi:trimeric autotransporter adhesin
MKLLIRNLRTLLLLSLCIATFSSGAQTDIIHTFAGSGTVLGDGGPATSARILNPGGVCIDKWGNVLIAEQNGNRIRKVNPLGIITTIAGNGTGAYSGDGGQATAAEIWFPCGVTTDTIGNIYIADEFNNIVRKVDTGGIITTIAGTPGMAGYDGDGGPATLAHLWHPADVAADRFGNVYFVDQDNCAARKIDVNGIIHTVAGICCTTTPGYNGDGIPGDSAKLNYPQGISVDTAGNVYIADFYNSRVRKVTMTTGIITTVAGNGSTGFGGDGGPATAATLYNPSALGVDYYGNIYLTDYTNNRIRKVDVTTGTINTVAGDSSGFCGDGGPATAACLSYPQGVTADTLGHIYIADYANYRVRKVEPGTLHSEKTLMTEQLKMHPNPVEQQLNIEISNTSDGAVVKCYNSVGIVALSTRFTGSIGLVDVSQLSDGLYMVQVITEKHVFTEKIIVRH